MRSWRDVASRAARAGGAAALVVALASAAHVAAGAGSGATGWLLALVVVAGAALVLAPRATTPGRLVVLLGGGQLLVHLSHVAVAAGAAAGTHCYAPRGASAADPGGVFAAVPAVASCGAAAGRAADAVHLHVLPSPLMLLAHAAATLVTAAVLARAQRLLEAVAGLFRVRPRPATPTVAVPGRRPVPAVRAPRPATGPRRGPAPTRGPPLPV